MPRLTGTYHKRDIAGETVRAFVPHPLPPRDPALQIDVGIDRLHSEAAAALTRLAVASTIVPNAQWFLYGFVRKEALISSQIEGTQATLNDVLAFEVSQRADRPAEVEEVCNYVDALAYARRELNRPKGLPLCTRLLCQAHARLMRGVRGAEKQPGIIRTSQNWIGGTRPGNALFVPPPPEEVAQALGALEQWIHQSDEFPPLIRAGLAHVQFETIHPFLDGNGRIGRLLITLLVEHWALLESPLLYLSLAFKRHREQYYERLSAVRTHGDWEGWTEFFLKCVCEAANDAVDAAQRLFAVLGRDRTVVTAHRVTTVATIRLFDQLPEHPMVTLAKAIELLQTSKPTAIKAIDALCRAGVLHEITGKQRDRIYAYRSYLTVLAEDTELPTTGASTRRPVSPGQKKPPRRKRRR